MVAGTGYGGAEFLPHALLLCFPAQGHINPMIHLAQRLLSFDFSVTIVITEPFYHGLSQSCIGQMDRASLRSIPDPFGGNPSHQNILLLMNSEQEEVIQPVEHLLKDLCGKGQRPSCIVFDFFFSWAVDLARRFQIPCAGLWTASFAYLLFCRSIPRLISQGYLPPNQSHEDETQPQLVTCIPGFPALQVSDFPSALQLGDPYDPMLHNRIKRSKKLEEATWILANTYEELEHGSMAQIPQSVAIGPLLIPAAPNETEFKTMPGAWREDHFCLQWLDSKPYSSVLYISFGSLACLSFEQMQQLAEGLEASEQYFLWVFRQDLVDGSVQMFMDDFTERNRHIGLVISWAPQLQVLGHPSVGGFLTHCGWNSALESICMGVPMLCWPCVSEQHLNCKFIVDVWKIGLRFGKGSHGLIKKNDIARLVQRLMKENEGSELRKAVEILKDAGRRAVMPGGSSWRAFEKFTEEIKKRTVCKQKVVIDAADLSQEHLKEIA